MSNSLRKYERLRHRNAIDEVFRTGKSVSVFPYRVYFRLNDGPPVPASCNTGKTLFGVGVGKRYFKKAVDRNRIKRLTREAYRLQKHDLVSTMATKSKNLDLFFVYTAKSLPKFDECLAAIANALSRIQKQITGTT